MKISIENQTYILDPDKLEHYCENIYIYSDLLVSPKNKDGYEIIHEKNIILINVETYIPLQNATLPQTEVQHQFISRKLANILNGLKKLDVELTKQKSDTVILQPDLQLSLGMVSAVANKEFDRNMLINILNSGAEFFVTRN